MPGYNVMLPGRTGIEIVSTARKKGLRTLELHCPTTGGRIFCLNLPLRNGTPDRCSPTATLETQRQR